MHAMYRMEADNWLTGPVRGLSDDSWQGWGIPRVGAIEKREDEPMNAKDLNRAGHVSMGIAMVAAVVGALSLTSVPNAALASSDDRSSDDSSSSDDRGGSNSSSDSNGGDSNDRSSDSNGGDSNDNSRDDNGGDTSGHGSDDVGYDDKGGNRGGNAGGNGSQNGVLLPVLNDVVAEWETRGYRVLEIDREDGTVVEMKVITPEGKRVEMYVDAASNTILSQRLDN
jgi:hypothetical protein